MKKLNSRMDEEEANIMHEMTTRLEDHKRQTDAIGQELIKLKYNTDESGGSIIFNWPPLQSFLVRK